MMEAIRDAVTGFFVQCPRCESVNVSRYCATYGGSRLLEIDYVCRDCSFDFGINGSGKYIEVRSAVKQWDMENSIWRKH